MNKDSPPSKKPKLTGDSASIDIEVNSQDLKKDNEELKETLVNFLADLTKSSVGTEILQRCRIKSFARMQRAITQKDKEIKLLRREVETLTRENQVLKKYGTVSEPTVNSTFAGPETSVEVQVIGDFTQGPTVRHKLTRGQKRKLAKEKELDNRAKNHQNRPANHISAMNEEREKSAPAPITVLPNEPTSLPDTESCFSETMPLFLKEPELQPECEPHTEPEHEIREEADSDIQTVESWRPEQPETGEPEVEVIDPETENDPEPEPRVISVITSDGHDITEDIFGERTEGVDEPYQLPCKIEEIGIFRQKHGVRISLSRDDGFWVALTINGPQYALIEGKVLTILEKIFEKCLEEKLSRLGLGLWDSKDQVSNQILTFLKNHPEKLSVEQLMLENLHSLPILKIFTDTLLEIKLETSKDPKLEELVGFTESLEKLKSLRKVKVELRETEIKKAETTEEYFTDIVCMCNNGAVDHIFIKNLDQKHVSGIFLIRKILMISKNLQTLWIRNCKVNHFETRWSFLSFQMRFFEDAIKNLENVTSLGCAWAISVLKHADDCLAEISRIFKSFPNLATLNIDFPSFDGLIDYEQTTATFARMIHRIFEELQKQNSKEVFDLDIAAAGKEHQIYKCWFDHLFAKIKRDQGIKMLEEFVSCPSRRFLSNYLTVIG